MCGRGELVTKSDCQRGGLIERGGGLNTAFTVHENDV